MPLQIDTPRTRRAASIAAWGILLCVLFPPWLYTYDQNGSSGQHTRKPAGFSFILSAPSPEQPGAQYGVSLDLSRLWLEWVIIGSVATVALLRRPKPDQPKQPAPADDRIVKRSQLAKELLGAKAFFEREGDVAGVKVCTELSERLAIQVTRDFFRTAGAVGFGVATAAVLVWMAYKL